MRPVPFWLLALAGLGSIACTPPRAQPAQAAAANVRPIGSPEPVTWTTRLDRDQPLVGRIWSVREGRFVEEAQVLAALRGYVLLGEKHDNPDHHALQARLLRAMVDAGRKPVVAFEMFDGDDQPALDAGLPIVATGLPRSRMRALMKPAGGSGAGDGGALTADPLDEGTPLTPEQEASLRDELRESHCGHLPDSRLGAMLRFQRARDAAMASALIAATDAAHQDDAVLVAGTGHTRRDRGAGRDLLARDPKRPVVSIAFAEVQADKKDPAAYASRWNASALPFDFVWFTPRATDEDPCAAFAH